MEQLVENRSATEKNMHKNKHVVGAAQQRSKIDFSSYPRPAGIATHLTTGVNRPGDSGMGHTWTMAAALVNGSYDQMYLRGGNWV